MANENSCFFCAGNGCTNQHNEQIPCPFCDSGTWGEPKIKELSTDERNAIYEATGGGEAYCNAVRLAEEW